MVMSPRVTGDSDIKDGLPRDVGDVSSTLPLVAVGSDVSDNDVIDVKGVQEKIRDRCLHMKTSTSKLENFSSKRVFHYNSIEP
ncbi:Hypothetical predicted protein [Octopus vulgaris]|uniref:Uncharacterized protein n=1 Tax=Octopus vulgaris TaxID=6645 RepID=A0AA36BL18_OCTVU|nr:Hypothetical predicted protein [Octopus vulgaris]